jgi:hypothetical protein
MAVNLNFITGSMADIPHDHIWSRDPWWAAEADVVFINSGSGVLGVVSGRFAPNR